MTKTQMQASHLPFLPSLKKSPVSSVLSLKPTMHKMLNSVKTFSETLKLSSKNIRPKRTSRLRNWKSAILDRCLSTSKRRRRRRRR